MSKFSFCINNLFQDISLKYFKETARNLEEKLYSINPKIISKVYLISESFYYKNLESYDLFNERSIKLQSLNKDIWDEYDIILFKIEDKNSGDKCCCCNYEINLSFNKEYSKKISFYGQFLDENSQKLLCDFKKVKLTQRIRY